MSKWFDFVKSLECKCTHNDDYYPHLCCVTLINFNVPTQLNLQFNSGIMRSIFILRFLITSINCLQNKDSSSDVVRVRMPFHSDYKAHWPPFWIYDNTTDTVTGYLKDLLDAVFTSANLSYSLAGINDVAAFRAKGYNYFGRDSRFTT